MNTKHYTSIEMSKKLLELGLNPDTADMIIVKDNTYYNALSAFNEVTLCQNYNEIKDKTNYIPCWSLGALLEVMPKYIYTPTKEELRLHIFHIDGRWNFEYGYSNNSYSILQQDKDLLNVAYNMVVWLLENGYIKKGE